MTRKHALFATKRSRTAFTLVELMIVIAIIGVLAALAIYGVRTYLAHSKTSEAKQTVGAIARGGAAAYERESTPGALLTSGSSATGNQQSLCQTSNPVPKQFVGVQGKKYQPNTAPGKDFNAGSSTQGWQCIKFNMSQAISYRYQYVLGNPGGPVFGMKCGGGSNAFYGTAMGDVDGNWPGSGWDTVSTFSRCGQVDAATHSVKLSTQIFTRNPTE